MGRCFFLFWEGGFLSTLLDFGDNMMGWWVTGWLGSSILCYRWRTKKGCGIRENQVTVPSILGNVNLS